GRQVGYFEAGSHRLCPIESCPIASPKLNEAIAGLSRELRGLPPFTANVELFTNESAVQVNLQDRISAAARPVVSAIGSPDPIDYGGFRVSRSSFFQVNRFLIEPLVDACTAGLTGRHAMDLYAGVGLFSMALARTYERVTAVESGWSAFRDLEFNAQKSSP